MMSAAPFLRRARSVVAFVLCLLFFNLPASYALDSRNTPAYQRAKVLGYLLTYDLGNLHFSHKKIDDELSKNAFTLYMKQLDSQKRFFLKQDVKKLAVYTKSIDDEIKSGDYELPDLATSILLKRAAAVKEMVKQLLSKDFNFSGREYVETDPEKLDYCETEGALRERWRKILELQVLHQLLNLEDEAKEQTKGGKGGVAAAPFEKTAREKVLRTYETFFSELQERSEKEKYERYFNSLTRAYDPHTEYMPPSSKEDFDISMRGTLEGIGATLREEDGYIKVVEIVPGSPAFRQGQLQPEDIILKVAEKDKEPVDITYMGVKGAVKLIRGKKGTEVRLTIKKPSGSRMVVPIVRDVIKLEDNFVKSAVLKDGNGGAPVGYIKIPAFYRDFDHTGGNAGRNCTDDVRKELNKLKAARIRGLILDLRNDGGGALTDAIKTAGLFIKTGPVVQVKASDGKISVLADEDPGISYSGPMVVLVNKFSASASEILAGALQDYGRAIVIGGDTHGKGTVQTIIDLNDFLRTHDMGIKGALGALKITTQKFYRISGASTQYRGVTPDIVLPDQFQGLKTGEQYLDYALPWDTINPAAYSKWTNSRPDIRELRARSEKRVRANKEFADITKENEELIEMQKKTLQPLNIDEARKDEEELKEVTKKRDSGNPHGGIHSGKKKDTSHLSEEGRRQAWIKDVGEDPYVRESVSVLDDMRSPRKTSASN